MLRPGRQLRQSGAVTGRDTQRAVGGVGGDGCGSLDAKFRRPAASSVSRA